MTNANLGFDNKTIQPSDFGKVAVLFGGHSAERAVSMASGSCVLSALQEAGVDAHKFDPVEYPIGELLTQGFDRAFIILHGRGGEDGSMQGALQTLGMPYTGTGVLGSALAMDKVYSKQVWSALGLPTAKYRVVRKSDIAGGAGVASLDYDEILAYLGGVAMVKPAREGSSIGMAKVSDQNELCAAIAEALKYDDDVLVESYIDGPEYTVSILNGQALPSIRMSTPHVFYDYDAKYRDSTTEYYCPSGLDDSTEKALGELALSAFSALSGIGWGRVDVMRTSDGSFMLLESNTVPGMTETSLVPKAAKQAGMSFQELVLRILMSSLER
ncbi:MULTISPECIES: D-alanine--D-alanine ligase [Alteromonadaceae]|jgi:D-alanine-D-alanine ligase|uniref:D-alanine--D-alanine ligase n=1 Tax=Brumicola blandensis TaxID=3075611 RepID=A0AAW8R617_9ALTE|nr:MULTISPECIES: D-alanine--D-alanine ligase [unclassified Alteromonas]MDT0583260.1 D-alanine--D-alanine ligase [Alteromonas sp. W409]MDT0627566.1 D-alanine--D-alanine ligase [Alteromonas sp. W364]